MSIEITVIGDVNVDLLSSPIFSFPKKDQQTLIPSINLQIGGGAANSAFAFSRLGLKTRLISLIGKDVFGEYVIEKIKEFGIDDKIRKIKKNKTGITFGIQFKDGSKSLLGFRGTNSLFSLNDFRLDDIRGKVCHIGGYNLLDNLRKDVYEILKHAKEKGMLISFDPDLKGGLRSDIKELKKILKIVDFFFSNKTEGKILTSNTNKIKIVKNLLEFGCKIVALKCGREGCVVGDKNKIFTIKGIKVKPVNPTGVGDIFNAAFIFNYLKTGNIKKAGLFANATSALSLSRTYENRFPTKKDVLKFLENRSFKH